MPSMIPPVSLGKFTGRIYYRSVDLYHQASGWISGGTDFIAAFSLWPRKPELWAECEGGAWRIQ